MEHPGQGPKYPGISRNTPADLGASLSQHRIRASVRAVSVQPTGCSSGPRWPDRGHSPLNPGVNPAPTVHAGHPPHGAQTARHSPRAGGALTDPEVFVAQPPSPAIGSPNGTNALPGFRLKHHLHRLCLRYGGRSSSGTTFGSYRKLLEH